MRHGAAALGPQRSARASPDLTSHRRLDALAAPGRPGARVVTDAWRLRANVTFSDAVYVALAEHLGAELLTDDHNLVATPNLSIRTLHLSRP